MVRHAPVAAAGVCSGQRDVATLMDAEEAATRVERALSEMNAPRWDAIWSSPWQRAEAVARVLASRSGVAHHRDARLSELSFGQWEGARYSELSANDAERFTAWMRDYDTVAPPGGETANALLERVRRFLVDVEQSHHAVLAVAHAGTIRAARAVRAGVRFSDVVQTPVEFLVPERI